MGQITASSTHELLVHATPHLRVRTDSAWNEVLAPHRPAGADSSGTLTRYIFKTFNPQLPSHRVESVWRLHLFVVLFMIMY
jgi:hypothetical protein